MSTAADRIVIEECGDCGRRWALPRSLCPHCGSAEVRKIEASGRGRVYSATLVHRAPTDAFKPLLPYRIALIDLEEGPRLMAQVKDDVPIGAAVAGRMEEIAGTIVPVFQGVVGSKEQSA
jgi:uncharacterized OB-fold protein